MGRLCHWTHQGETDAEDFESFGAYQRTLELKCDKGEPGVIQWTPDKDTPDTVYYQVRALLLRDRLDVTTACLQCFTHRYLGWKINVLDECDQDGEASAPKPVYAKPDSSEEDLEQSPSIRVETRVKPNDLIATSGEKPDNDQQILNVPEFGTIFYEQPPIYLISETIVPQPNPQAYAETHTLAPVRLNLNSHQIGAYPNNPTQTIPLPRVPYKNVAYKMRNHPHPQIRPQLMFKDHKHPSRHISLSTYKKTYPKVNTRTSPSKRPTISILGNSQNKPYDFNVIPPQTPDHFLNAQHHMHVEISPQQASTEREPSEVMNADLKPAINTGFHPESVVIEGGFKPIIHKNVDRGDLAGEGPELNYESSIGFLNVDEEKNKNVKILTPPAINSEEGRLRKKIYKRRTGPKKEFVLVKRGRSQDEDAAGLSQVPVGLESYYMPPVTQDKPRPSDIDLVPGTVVTYDGKMVPGSNLGVKIQDRYVTRRT